MGGGFYRLWSSILAPFEFGEGGLVVVTTKDVATIGIFCCVHLCACPYRGFEGTHISACFHVHDPIERVSQGGAGLWAALPEEH